MKTHPGSLATRILLLVALLVPAAAARAGDEPRPVRPDQLTYPPLKVAIPEPERIEMDNGMVLYYLEDRTLPLVDLTLWFRCGSVLEPAEKAGLAGFAAAWARNGGAGGRNRVEFDTLLESLAAEMDVSIADEHGEASLSVLKKDVGQGLGLLADLLRRPAFDPMLLPLLQQNFARQILAQEDTPAGVLSRTFPGLLYAGHPYGRVPTVKTVSAITREDCVAFWQRYVVPNGMIVGVAGDIGRDDLLAKLEAAFGDWAPSAQKVPAVPAVEGKQEGRIVVVPRPEGQSHIRIGSLGLKRTDPDRVVCDVMNLILGGAGFSSRLSETVRVREGLAYDVGSYFTRQVDLGLFTAEVQTKAETTFKAIRLILDEMRRIRDEPVSDEELTLAKDMVLNGLVFGYAVPFNVVDNHVSLEYYGYPRDWIRLWKATIEGVTKEDVQRVARAYLKPDEVTIVVVGDPARFDPRPEGLPEPVILGDDGR